MTLLALSLLVAACSAQAGFGPEETLFPDITASAIAVGDIDGDGRDDIVMLVRGGIDEPDTVRISLQQPDGSMKAPEVVLEDELAILRIIRLADMTADGRPDIVLGTSNGVWLLTSHGNTQFTSRMVSLESVTDLATDDFDGDGHRDVIVLSGGSFVVLHGDGTGDLGDPVIHVPGYATNRFQLVDAEGDGDLDVAFLDGDRIRILERNETGFTGSSRSSPVPIRGSAPSNPTFADFNGDGLVDYAIGKRTNSGSNPTVTLVIQRPGGRFQQIQSLATLDLPDNLLFRDIDNDGDLDLLVPHPGWYGVSVYRSNGHNLLIEERYPAYSAHSSHAIATGDLNSDGHLDVVMAVVDSGLRFMPGQKEVPGPDPRINSSVDAAAATIRMRNGGDRITSESVYLEVDIHARHGSVQAGNLPSGCNQSPEDNAGTRITCFLPPLGAGADVPLTLPLAGVDTTSLNRLTVDARISAGRDIRPHNNRSRAQGLVLPVAKDDVVGRVRSKAALLRRTAD